MIDVAELATLIPFMTPEERAELDLLLTSPTKYDPLDYIDDPAGYGRDILGEHYTDDIIRVMESVRDYPITIAESSNAVGKSQPIFTPVLTPSGFVPIGTIRPGDFVIGANGEKTRVVAIHPQGLQPTYEIKFNDDTNTLCSGDHLWTVRSASDKYYGRKWQTLTTFDLVDQIKKFMHIPMCQPVQFPKKKLLIDPYVMGVLIGDGTLGQYVRFDSADEFIVNEVTSRVGSDANVKRYRKSGIHHGLTTEPGKPNPVLKACQKYGLIGSSALSKKIPDDYMFGSVEQRKLLLMGIMDTDGDIGKDNHSMSVTTISPELAEQIQSLVWSLGGTAKIKTRYTKFTHLGKKRTGKLSYRIGIKVGFCPFMLPRKTERYKPQDEMTRQAYRVIRSISYVGEMDSVCIQVESGDGLYLTEKYIVTHNSHGAARVALWWYNTRKAIPGTDSYVQVYTAAAPPLENLKNILWGQIYHLTNSQPHLFKDDKVGADLSITYDKDNRSFITGVTIPKQGSPQEREGAFSGKHAPYLLFILDEADVIPEEVFKGIDSCLSGGKGKLLCMYNPRSDSGYVSKLKKQGANTIRISAFDHPNVVTGDDSRYPGAVTQNKTIHRIHQWTIPAELAENVTGYGRFNVPSFLVGKVAFNELNNELYPPLPAGERVIINPDFAYMVLGVYPGVNKGSIYDVWVDKWDEYMASVRNDEAGWAILNTVTHGTYQDVRRIPMSRLPKNQLLVEVMRSNVTPFADYIPGGGSIVWSMDDGYAGEIDPQTMTFTADSHPRAIGFFQLRANGDLVLFDEFYKVQEPKPEVQIEEALKRGYPRPDYVTIGPGSAALGGILDEMGFYKNRVMVEVEERIKLMRQWIAPDYKSHRRLLVHPRCKHFRHEMKNYKRDEKGRILKQYDHGCLVAGTEVMTTGGVVPIERIWQGDMVLTRAGYRSVAWSGMTNQHAKTITVELSDGRILRCTPDHPVWINGKNFVPAGELQEYDIIQDVTQFIREHGSELCQESKRLFTRELFLDDTQTRPTGQRDRTTDRTGHMSSAVLWHSIERYGRIILEKYQRATQFITKTAIPAITRRTISNASPPQDTTPLITNNGMMNTSRSSGTISTKYDTSHQRGTEQTRAESFIPNWQKAHGRIGNIWNSNADTAASLTPRGQLTPTTPIIAHPIVDHTTGETLELMTLTETANGAENNLGQIAMSKNKHAPVLVRRIYENQGREPVYNLVVEGDPEFFANGVLVHNCDAVGYLIWHGRNGF